MLTENRSFPARNYLVIVDFRAARPTAPFETAIKEIGRSYRLNPTTWLLQAETTIGSIRNTVAPHLGATDTLLIVDVGEGRKLIWQFGPEADAHLRASWAGTEALPVVEQRITRRRNTS